ncbi:alpha-ketoglutarate-dependent dioxygenase AlkB [Coralliovum pocilloporae]|uniref:alpha-ketoglutarate-dependent dioxygenase AlkB n=1 Tax=Coralliovum pocilloporae TaxID=3066369 RepID=UPI0033071E7A
MAELLIRNARYLPGALSRNAQTMLRDAILSCLSQAPLFRPSMPRSGKPFSVRMSNCGSLGWVSDKAGYRYQSTHPDTGLFWPDMPQQLRTLWRDLLPNAAEPEACLINVYDAQAKLGLHQDRDEVNLDAPVLSISLGATALFRIGGTTRGGKTNRITLQSGDILILDGDSRLAYHGVTRIYPGTSTLLKNVHPDIPEDGRINLTLRRVNKSEF